MTDLGLKAVIWGALAFCYFLSWRSRRRREMGLCCACGTNQATQVLALDSFCDACARKTAHTYRVGSQFFAFLLAFMVIMFAWMWLEPGSNKDSLPWDRFAAALFVMAAFVVWLRRSPAKIDTKSITPVNRTAAIESHMTKRVIAAILWLLGAWIFATTRPDEPSIDEWRQMGALAAYWELGRPAVSIAAIVVGVLLWQGSRQKTSGRASAK